MLAILRCLLPCALIIERFLLFKEERSLRYCHIHFPCRSKFFILILLVRRQKLIARCAILILLVRRQKLIARCAILSHEPKIAEATLVSSSPRSPPSEGFHLATTFRLSLECRAFWAGRNKLGRWNGVDLAVMQGSGYYQRDKTRWRTLYWTVREIIQRKLAIIPWHSFAASNSEGTNYFFSRSFSVLFNFSPANKYLYWI